MDPHYSAALDHIHGLRVGFAIEAATLAEVLRYRTLPAAAQDAIRAAIRRMCDAASGDLGGYDEVPSLARQELLVKAGASPTLTRAQWEASCTS